MQVHFGLGALRAEWQKAVICVGTFDGVHLGHRQVIQTAVQQAFSREQPCLLVTFDRHPAAVLAPEKKPPSLASLEQNLAVFRELGVAVAVILPFDRTLSLSTASEFLHGVLVGKLRADSVVVGHDFAMGRDRQGNEAWLRQHIETTVVPAFVHAGERVSSSRIRELISSGNVEGARALLGRPYELTGVVVSGRRLGRTLGYPTANIGRSGEQAVPADGVYAGRFTVSGQSYVAAASVGTRPAVGGTTRTVEAYLLDYPGDFIYGFACGLAFTRRLREELNFTDLPSLVTQIDEDVQQVRLLAASLKL